MPTNLPFQGSSAQSVRQGSVAPSRSKNRLRVRALLPCSAIRKKTIHEVERKPTARPLETVVSFDDHLLSYTSRYDRKRCRQIGAETRRALSAQMQNNVRQSAVAIQRRKNLRRFEITMAMKAAINT